MPLTPQVGAFISSHEYGVKQYETSRGEAGRVEEEMCHVFMQMLRFYTDTLWC